MSHLKRILSYTKLYWKRLLFSGIAATLYGLFSAAPTYVIRYIVDMVFVDRLEHLFIPFIVGFIGLFLIKGVFMYASNYYMNWVGNRVVNDIRLDLFKKIIHFPLSFFQEKTSGQLMTHFLSDIALIQNASSSAIRNGTRSFFEALSLLIVAAIQNWKLALVMIILGPLIALTMRKMGKRMRTTAYTSQDKMGIIGSTLQETFSGVREIKSFNAEETESRRFEKKLEVYFGSIMRNVRAVSITPALIEIFSMSTCGVLLYIAGRQVLEGTFTPGQLSSFFAALLFAYQPVKRLVNVYSDVQEGLSAAERIFKIMDMTYPSLRNTPTQTLSFKNEIRFENVSFSYIKNHPVLENISLTIKKGECLGIIGPSGSGKSTLCDLLLGFIEPTQGNIYIDNINTRNISLANLRNHIGYVGQQTFLFNDTIEANVSYAHPGIQHDAILEACKNAYAHDFVDKLAEKYQTVVGENGTLLSGGQKQRLTIARALLKNPDILIFDEATSALDPQSEEMIQKAMEEICKRKTVIIISHRLSFINNMDRIIMIKDKSVIELPKTSITHSEAFTFSHTEAS